MTISPLSVTFWLKVIFEKEGWVAVAVGRTGAKGSAEQPARISSRDSEVSQANVPFRFKAGSVYPFRMPHRISLGEICTLKRGCFYYISIESKDKMSAALINPG